MEDESSPTTPAGYPPRWVRSFFERGGLFVSGFLSTSRAGNQERRQQSTLNLAANCCRPTERCSSRSIASQRLSSWAWRDLVSEKEEVPLLRRALRRARAARADPACSYSVNVRMPRREVDGPAIRATLRESTDEVRNYTLLWDSADVMGYEEKQARARLWRRTVREGSAGRLEDTDVLYLCFDFMATLSNLTSYPRWGSNARVACSLTSPRLLLLFSVLSLTRPTFEPHGGKRNSQDYLPYCEGLTRPPRPPCGARARSAASGRPSGARVGGRRGWCRP